MISISTKHKVADYKKQINHFENISQCNLRLCVKKTFIKMTIHDRLKIKHRDTEGQRYTGINVTFFVWINKKKILPESL